MKAHIKSKIDRTPLGSMEEVSKCHGNLVVEYSVLCFQEKYWPWELH